MTIYHTVGMRSVFVRVNDYIESGGEHYPVENVFYLDGKKVDVAECWINIAEMKVKLDGKVIRVKHIGCDKDFRDYLDIPVRTFCFESLMPEEEEE